MLEPNGIYCGNCVHLLESLPTNHIDLTITSPPYDNLREYNSFTQFDLISIIYRLYTRTKEGGIVVWIVGDSTKNGTESGTSFKHTLLFKKHGFLLHDTMIYAKNNPRPTSGKRYQQNFEYMFVFSKGKPKTFNPIMEECKYKGMANMRNRGTNNNTKYRKVPRTTHKKIGNIWYYSIGGGISTKDKIAYKHPAIFPEQLVHDHIISWSNPGDLILDPMCGSGTVCKMAKAANRNFIGMDISEEYCTIARERVKLN